MDGGPTEVREALLVYMQVVHSQITREELEKARLWTQVIVGCSVLSVSFQMFLVELMRSLDRLLLRHASRLCFHRDTSDMDQSV